MTGNIKGGVKPLIIYCKNDMAEMAGCIEDNFGPIKYKLPFIKAICADVPENKVRLLRQNKQVLLMEEDASVAKLPVSPVELIPASLSSVFEINASGKSEKAAVSDADKQKNRHQSRKGEWLFSNTSCEGGEGVSVAIIDTGVAPHYDIVKPRCRIAAFVDFLHKAIVPYDDDGHGTHVTGIAIGNGYACGGRYIGTAPRANLVALKALDEHGNGLASDILAAMQWICDHYDKYNIKVVNLSLGITPGSHDQYDPLMLGAGVLVSKGITVVAAAGNGGPERASVTSPGISPLVISVGSASKNLSRVADFSSRGPAPSGLIKPDIIAPGVDIVSLEAKTRKKYAKQTGTSMSAPLVSGIAACLHAAYPRLSPEQVKTIILASASPLKKEDRGAQGHGLIKI